MLGIASARGISSALPAMARAVGTAAADAATAAGSICDGNFQPIDPNTLGPNVAMQLKKIRS